MHADSSIEDFSDIIRLINVVLSTFARPHQQLSIAPEWKKSINIPCSLIPQVTISPKYHSKEFRSKRSWETSLSAFLCILKVWNSNNISWTIITQMMISQRIHIQSTSFFAHFRCHIVSFLLHFVFKISITLSCTLIPQMMISPL
jgi:hypothetical protein